MSDDSDPFVLYKIKYVQSSLIEFPVLSVDPRYNPLTRVLAFQNGATTHSNISTETSAIHAKLWSMSFYIALNPECEKNGWRLSLVLVWKYHLRTNRWHNWLKSHWQTNGPNVKMQFIKNIKHLYDKTINDFRRMAVRKNDDDSKQ